MKGENTMKRKFNVGQRIKIKDKHGVYIGGHVVLILNMFSDDRVYYCSMYPGALEGYEYVSVVDLNSCGFDDEGRISIVQPLNKYKEDELEASLII